MIVSERVLVREGVSERECAAVSDSELNECELVIE
jgi:hypothetical protein